MNLFFHHVGKKGADQDFPKTVYQKHSISKIVSEGVLLDKSLIELLLNKFPNDEFNCWGVPKGASSVIKNLREGDVVLLVESSRIDGTVPVLCPVKIFWRHQLSELSEYLWGDSKFPFIFFYDTVSINLSWTELLEDLDFKSNFSPRGHFYKVSSERLARFDGVSFYVNKLINKSSSYSGEDIQISVLSEDQVGYNIFDIQNEENKIDNLLRKEPSLIDETVIEQVIKRSKRDQAFSALIKKYYKFKCAICSQSVKSLNGKYALQAAHIYPKSKFGSDDLRNGICLCLMHHWAFDAGWLHLTNDYKIIIHGDIPRTDDYKEIFKWEGETINLPENEEVWPHKIFLAESRKLYGFEQYSI